MCFNLTTLWGGGGGWRILPHPWFAKKCGTSLEGSDKFPPVTDSTRGRKAVGKWQEEKFQAVGLKASVVWNEQKQCGFC